MRRIDELHLNYPFAGARMLARMLKREALPVGRRHVSTLMKRMGVNALYRKPNTSKRHPSHPVYPYLLRNLNITPYFITFFEQKACKVSAVLPRNATY